MKLKSHSASKKRVKITGKGKMLFRKSSKKHLMINKSKRQKKLFKDGMPMAPRIERNMHKLLPYA